MISKLIDSMEIDHLLDYGCGELDLAKTLTPERSFTYQAFDATVPEYADEPVPAEMVVCIDSLSQIHPWQVDDVLDHLEVLVEHVIFLTMTTERMPLEWWLPRIMQRFSLQRVQVTATGVCIVAYKRLYAVH